MAEKEEVDLETEEGEEIVVIEEVLVIEEAAEEDRKSKTVRQLVNNQKAEFKKIFRIDYCSDSKQTNKRKLCYSQKERSIEKCRKAV
jgi:sugar diacid utilization regulator